MLGFQLLLLFNANPSVMRRDIEYFVDWLGTEKGYSPHTVDGYRRDLMELYQFLGKELSSKEVDPYRIRKFIVSLHGVNSSYNTKDQ